MKHLSTLILLLLFNTITLFCQPYIESRSDDYECPKQMFVRDMLTLSNGTTILVRDTYKSKADIVIERFDENLKRTYTAPLVLKYKDTELSYNYLIKLKEEMYVVSSFENKKDLATYYFAQHLDSETLKLDKNYIKIIQSNNNNENKLTWGWLKYVYSPDSTKILFYIDKFNKYSSLLATTKTKEIISFSIFDSQLNKICNVEKELDVLPSKFHMLDYQIVGDKICLLAKEYIDRGGNVVGGKVNIFYRLLIFDCQGNILNEEIISPTDKLVRDLQLVVDKNNNIICAGYYSNTGIVAIHGSYFMQIDGSSFKKKTEYYNEYSNEFLYQRMSKKELKEFKKIGEETNYDIPSVNKVFPLNDGNTLMIHEQFRHKVGQQGGQYKEYGFINVVCVDPRGKLLWGQRIPRFQLLTEMTKAWTSYLFMKEKNYYYFVFNDHRDNVDADGSISLSRFSKENQASVQFARISSNGKNYSKAQMASLNEIGTLISPPYSKAFSNDNRIVCCFGKGRYVLCKLSTK